MYLPKKVSGTFQSFKKKWVLAAQQVSEDVLSRLVEWQKQLLLTSTRNLYQHRSMSKMIRKQQWTKDKLCGPASAFPWQCLRVGGDIEPLSSDFCLIPGICQRIQIEEKWQMMCCASCGEELLCLQRKQMAALSRGFCYSEAVSQCKIGSWSGILWQWEAFPWASFWACSGFLPGGISRLTLLT